MALLFSCGYQKNELTPIAKATDTTDILVVDIQTDSEVTIEEDDVALTKDIFDLFDIFFKKFVVVTNKNKFDTLVDYTKLHELKTK